MDGLKTACKALYFDTCSDPTERLIRPNAFERLNELVNENQPLGRRMSQWVGLLASRIAADPQSSMEDELNWLQQKLSRKRGGKKRMAETAGNESGTSEEEEERGRWYHARRPYDFPMGRHGPFEDPMGRKFEGPFGESFKGCKRPAGGPFNGPYPFEGPFDQHFEGPFGKHGKHFDQRFGGPSGKHFGGPFGKHRKHFGQHFEGPFGKHGKHFDQRFGGPFGKHRKHFGGRFGKHPRGFHHYGKPFENPASGSEHSFGYNEDPQDDARYCKAEAFVLYPLE
ncbi:hypothetical protein BY458DRAFT_548914 [Sporodiniella umbellata]|nr:hypothetical protein BY458DRAFT_548914 [Sporodiniella umbellata]